MRRALVVLSAILTIAVPASRVMAQTPAEEKFRITFSGRAWANVDNVRATAGSAAGATAVKNRNRVTSNGSYLRVRAETTLVEGWKALAQVESELSIDGEEGTPFFSTRNTGVGLASPYGTLILGRWESPTKLATVGLDPFGGTGIFSYYNVVGQQQTGPTSQGSNRWDRRFTNGIHYTSPVLHGFKALAAYAVGETSSNGGLDVNPSALSAAIQYTQGPLYLGASYEIRTDCGNPDSAPGATNPSCAASALGSATQPNGTDSAIRAGVGYTIKPARTKLGFVYEHIDLQADAEGALPEKTLRRDVYWGTITQGLGSDAHELILAYGLATDVSGTNDFTDTADTGAQAFTAAYRFRVTKDADLYAGYTQVKNDRNATYRIGTGNFGNVPVGSTTRGFGGGIRYVF